MISTGTILSLVRLKEPVFQNLIRQFFLNCFGIPNHSEKDIVSSQALSSFLASSLNVELVHIILKGIKRFSNLRMIDHELSDQS